MAHFYGTVRGGRGEGTRVGHRNTGLTTVAASWSGAIRVQLYHDAIANVDRYRIYQETWGGNGVEELIAEGVVGEKSQHTLVTEAILT